MHNYVKSLNFLSIFLFYSILPIANNQNIDFNFKKEPVINIINKLAQARNINIILPQGTHAQTLNKITVTYESKSRQTLDKAWKLLGEFLNFSGFNINQKSKNLYSIDPKVKKEQPGAQQPLPLFVETKPEYLPNNVEPIRYINYLKNLKVPAAITDQQNPLSKVFRDLLSANATLAFDTKSNGFVISDSANKISNLMTIILALDSKGFRQMVEVVQLYNVPASQVGAVLDNLKKAAGEDKSSPFIRSDAQEDSLIEFAADTTVVVNNINNSLILMGRENIVMRLSDFIQKYVDIPQSSGESILHVYDLQYLDAQSFAGILQKILTNQATSNSQAEQTPTSGPYRMIQGVQVIAEKTITAKLPETSQITQEATQDQKGDTSEVKGLEGEIKVGGNRLIIAAMKQDWVIVKKVIEQLDQPQPQVVIEALIVDFTGIKNNKIAATTRLGPLLSSHITNISSVIGNNIDRPPLDLLQVIGPNPPSVAQSVESGSLLISFNDPRAPGIFSLFQILSQYFTTKIISHPFSVVLNNQRTTLEASEIRRNRGDVIMGPNGTVNIDIDDITATIKLEVIPHLTVADRVRLNIGIEVIEFTGSGLNRTVRSINTMANMGQGQVLALGGLLRDDLVEVVTRTPVIGYIPIVGRLFKGQSVKKSKTSIGIFISPMIIYPKVGLNNIVYTEDKIKDTLRDIQATLNISDKDPIKRLFFDSANPTGIGSAETEVRKYVNQSANINLFKPEKAHKKQREATKPIIKQIDKNSQEQATQLKELLALEDDSIFKNLKVRA